MSTTEKQALIVQGPSGLTVDRPAVLALYASIENEVATFEYDLTTEGGRAKIASLAYGIAKKRTAIEADKKRLKEGLLAQGREIDSAWNEIKDKLELLQAGARKPLTDWEEAEAARTAFVSGAFTSLTAAPKLQMTDTSETVAALLEATEGYELNPDVFLGDYAEAVKLKAAAIASLKISLGQLRMAEEEKAELAELRERTAAREKADKEAAEVAELARLQKEAADREAVRLAEIAEAAKVAEEQRQAREAAAIAQAAKDAEEKARLEAERVAKEAADKIEAQHQADLEAQKQERLKSEAKAREEQAKIDAEHKRELALALKAKADAEAKEREVALEAARAEERRKIEAETAAREAAAKAEADRKLAANKTHRKEITDAAVAALMAQAGLDESQARLTVLCITENKIPSVSIKFA